MFPKTRLFAALALVIMTGQVGCARKDVILKQGRIAAFKNPIDLDVAARQWQAIQNGDETQIAAYNETVGNVISQISFRMTKRLDEAVSIKTLNGDYPLIIDKSGIENPSSIDRVIPISSLSVKKGLNSDIRIDGVGAPLVVRQKWNPKDPMVAVTGLWYPVTAVLDLDDPVSPVMRFLDPTNPNHTQVTVGEKSFPLQANYTASIARDLYDRQSQFVNLSGLIKYEKFSANMGLFRISAFDPDKIPVVLVHGLKSTPNTFNNTLNEMMADPIVRERYEFWTFGYPTGAPIPFLSARLRREIKDMTAFRRRKGAASDRVTVLAHSMGGLIAKPLTQSSGRELWNQVFNVPPHELNVSRPDQKLLSDMFIFEPLPYIDRVIFMAVPHLGSPVADRKTMVITEILIQAPNNLVTLGKNLISDSNHQLTKVGREVVGRVPTSVQQLNQQSAAIKLFSPLPLNSGVKYHSIMGNEKGSERIANHLSSDGIVEYTSSHLPGCISEKVCKGKHGIHLYPEAITEIVRILNENVGYPNPAVRPKEPEASAVLVNVTAEVE